MASTLVSACLNIKPTWTAATAEAKASYLKYQFLKIGLFQHHSINAVKLFVAYDLSKGEANMNNCKRGLVCTLHFHHKAAFGQQNFTNNTPRN